MKSEYNKGYIKLWRSIFNWEWWHDKNTFRLWIVILLSVNWQGNNWQGREIPRGSMYTSIEKLSEMSQLTIQQTRTALKHLKDTNDITIEATKRGRLITVVKWDFWQGEYESLTNELTNDSTGEATNSLTNDSTTNKEYKEDKEYQEDNKNNYVVDSRDLMDLLTAEDIKALYNTYEEAGKLIDIVQEQIDNGRTTIKADAYKYICGYARNSNWPYRNPMEV